MNCKSIAVWGGITLLLAGCASQETASDVNGSSIRSAEAQVMERAQARWDASRAGDFEKAFSYTAPSYRAVADIKVFRAETAGSQSLVSAKVLKVECSSEASCSARIRIEFYEPLGFSKTKPRTIETHFDEPWIFEDGSWWLFKR